MCLTALTTCCSVIFGINKTKKMKGVTAPRVGLFAFGSLVVVLILRYGIASKIMTEEILKRLRLEPGTQLWDIWTDIPVPVFTRFHFFNVTNPAHVINGDKPIVVEVGPYTYQEKRMKVVLNHDEEQVAYRPRTTWFFRPDLSYGSEDDKITVLNIPFVAVAKIAWEMSKQPFILSTLDELLSEKGEKVFQTNLVRELLFDGVSIENYMELLSLPVTEAFGSDIKISERLMDGDFGFFDDRNGTADEVWIAKTGIHNMANFGKIISWNGQPKMDVWKDEECNKIKGTDGSVFPPFQDYKTRILTVFTPDMCRSLDLEYSKHTHFSGIPSMKYKLVPSTFGSVKDFPQNKCYCNGTYNYCEKGGLIPIGKCQQGAPLFVSRPHFVGAHPDYQNGVIGMKPDVNDIDSFIELEEVIGQVVQADFRFQMNVELQSYDAMPTFANVPNVMFPILWLQQTVTLTDDILLPVKILSIGLRVMNILTGIAVFLCLLTMAAAFLWEFKKGGKGKLSIKTLFC